MNHYLKRLFLWVGVTIVVVAVRYYMPYRDAEIEKDCHNILRQIQAGATSWGLEQGHSTGTAVIEQEVSSYIKGGRATVVCGKGGDISWGTLGSNPSCSIHGTPW